MESGEETQVDHSRLYKRSGKDASQIQKDSKKKLLDVRHKHRERLLTRKRLKVDTLHEGGERLTTEQEYEQVQEAIQLFKRGQKAEALTRLHRCFARDATNTETFIKSEGLSLLQSCLLCTDSNLLHLTVWCMINLSAVADVCYVGRMMKISPLLIQFLQGSDVTMQELCAWAIGNLAGSSSSSRKTLLNQGVIPHFAGLLSMSHLTNTHARTQSVIFALINLARDTSYDSIQCMQQHSIHKHLWKLLTNTPADCGHCVEMGWLACTIYSRRESLAAFGSQYEVMMLLTCEKLTHLSQLQDESHKEQAMIPYLVLCANVVGMSPDLAVMTSDLKMFLPAMCSCLSVASCVVHLETLAVLVNFCSEVSCRVLMAGHTEIIHKLGKICSSYDADVLDQVLYIFEALSQVSSFVNKLLVRRGLLQILSSILSQPLQLSTSFLERALLIVEDLLLELNSEEVPINVKTALKTVVSLSFNESVFTKANTLLQYFI